MKEVLKKKVKKSKSLKYVMLDINKSAITLKLKWRKKLCEKNAILGHNFLLNQYFQ